MCDYIFFEDDAMTMSATISTISKTTTNRYKSHKSLQVVNICSKLLKNVAIRSILGEKTRKETGNDHYGRALHSARNCQSSEGIRIQGKGYASQGHHQRYQGRWSVESASSRLSTVPQFTQQQIKNAGIHQLQFNSVAIRQLSTDWTPGDNCLSSCYLFSFYNVAQQFATPGVKTGGGRECMSFMNNIINEESLILRKRYLHICDNNILAAFLLYIFEEHYNIEGAIANMEDREERTLIYTGNTLVKYLYNICSSDEAFNAAHFLATKGFIAMWWANTDDKKTPRASRPFCIEYNNSYVTAYSRPYNEERDRLKMEQWERREQSSPAPIEKPRKIKLENKYKTEASRLDIQKKRAIKLGLPATLTLDEWIATLDYFNWTCAYCQGKYTVIEHFTPLAHGKGTIKENCVPACHACNSLKGTYHPSQITDPTLIAGIERVYEFIASLEGEVL